MITPLETSLENAKITMQLLAEWQIAPNPSNYAVAYTHVSGTHPELSVKLTKLIDNKVILDQYVLQELYQEYVKEPSSQVIAEELKEVLKSVLGSILETARDTGGSVLSLGEGLSKLATINSIEDVQAVATELIDVTKQIAKTQDYLKDAVSRANSEAARLQNELAVQKNKAIIDPLTGAYNRRELDARLKEIAQIENGTDVSLMFIDIDHFKKINDTWGHPVGDIVLKKVAETVLGCIKDTDTLARYGGEEFVVVLPGIGLEEAKLVAETIRRTIAALRIVRKRDNAAIHPFTASLGISVLKPKELPEDALSRADSALYNAKKEGRNKVQIAA